MVPQEPIEEFVGIETFETFRVSAQWYGAPAL